MSILFTSVHTFVADGPTTLFRYDILNRDRSSVNRPYMFVFDRLQVIDELASGWDDGLDGRTAQSSKKRSAETGSAEGSRASKWRAVASTSDDEEI